MYSNMKAQSHVSLSSYKKAFLLEISYTHTHTRKHKDIYIYVLLWTKVSLGKHKGDQRKDYPDLELFIVHETICQATSKVKRYK